MERGTCPSSSMSYEEREHPGNRHLHELEALKYEEYYDSAKRDRKTEIAEELVQQINKSSGRFLKRDDGSGMWVEVPNREARDKVCHGFRRKREWDLKKAKSPKKSTSTSRVTVMRIDQDDEKCQKRRKLSIDESREVTLRRYRSNEGRHLT